MFSFYGSLHTKYGSYILEFLCLLELKSSPEYKVGILRNWLSRMLTQCHKQTTSTPPCAGAEGLGQVKSHLRTG
jgi:hypothetical protein